MNEHRIRLAGRLGVPARRICRTARNASPFPAAGTLRDRGGCVSRGGSGGPRSTHCARCLLLELDQASGIHSLLLNGKAIAASSPSKSYYLIPLPDIEDRNLLVLEVETGQTRGDAFGKDLEWGNVALVIQPVE